MIEKEVCPFCEAKEVQVNVRETQAAAVFGPIVKVKEEVKTCGSCGALIDTGSKAYSKALALSAQASVKEIVDHLERNHEFTLGEIEASLELSHRSLSKWKYNKKISAPALALLRVIRKFPFVIEAAANKFSDDASDRLVIDHAFSRVCHRANVLDSGLSVAGVTFNVNGTLEDGRSARLTGMGMIGIANGILSDDACEPNKVTFADRGMVFA